MLLNSVLEFQITYNLRTYKLEKMLYSNFIFQCTLSTERLAEFI